MPVTNNRMTVSELVETLQSMEGVADLPIKIADYEGSHGMTVYSTRKHVITDEEGEVSDAYVVING